MRNIARALKHHLKLQAQTKKERRHVMAGPEDLWKLKRDFQFEFLKENGLDPEHYLLDIGCGTLRGGIPLINHLQAGHYYGIEVREEVLAEGRRELQDENLEHKKPTLFISKDISQLKIDRLFDYVWAFSVLIHMSDDILDHTLGFVRDHLSHGGAFYANVNIGERNEEHWQGFPVVWRTLDFYGQKCFDNGLSLTDLGTLKDHGHFSNIAEQDLQRMIRIYKS